MKIMKRSTIGILLVICITTLSYAQKKACDPSACGPTNTKIAEARILTEIRDDLAELKSSLKDAEIRIKESEIKLSSLKKLPLEVEQNHDDAALMLLFLELNNINYTLRNKDLPIQNYKSKAQMAASIKQSIADLKNSSELKQKGS